MRSVTLIYRQQRRALPLLIVGLIMIVVAPLTVMLPTWANGDGAHDPLWLPVNPAVERLWRAADGAVASGDAQRGWLWGPTANAMSLAPDAASPSGARQLAWFDKGRLDIADSSADPSNPWFVTGGLLVSELLSGVAQPGEVYLGPANIPVVGDLEQPNAVTYASFAKLGVSSDDLNLNTLRALFGDAASDAQRRDSYPAARRRLGAARGASDAKVIVNGYDDVTGHNIAAPFAAFVAARVIRPPGCWAMRCRSRTGSTPPWPARPSACWCSSSSAAR